MESIALVNAVLLIGALLVIAGIFSSLIASRFGAPLLLVFLVIGMLAGEDGPGGLVFDDYQLTFLVGSLALAVILFDGGLRTRTSRFRGVLLPAATLATLGVALTATVTGLLAIFAFNFSFLEGMLIGSVVASTDAAAVFFLLHAGGLQLKQRVSALLEIESGTNDPVALLLTIVLVELILAVPQVSALDVAAMLARQAVLGVGAGVAGGYAVSWLLNKVQLPGGLHPLFVVASAIFIFSLTSIIGGSGFLAAYLGGLVLGNRPIRSFASITSFHDTATWLCQMIMFLVLGLLVTPSLLVQYAVPALIIAIWLILVARPVSVWLCLAPFRFTMQEKAFVSWVGLRGAVSIFLAAIPMLTGLPHAEAYFNIAFFVVLVSLVVQGWSIAPVAKRLGMSLPGAVATVQRVEFDLPGQLHYEIVGYRLRSDSAVLGRASVPRWARPVLVVRDKAVLDTADAGPLQQGDYAYFLAPPHRVHRLDRLFAPTGAEIDADIADEIQFPGDFKLAELQELYGLAPEVGDRELTLADLFAERYHDEPETGDRLPLGAATLVARVLDQGRVIRVGVQSNALAGRAVKTALRARAGLHRLAAMGRRLRGRLSRASTAGE
ncbi:MAG TPA: potassium/proton antiporter [Gammaproteobacteria bacterium]|nr:potassium/proton antiporter [Gammaproteobacteria bacterium]